MIKIYFYPSLFLPPQYTGAPFTVAAEGPAIPLGRTGIISVHESAMELLIGNVTVSAATLKSCPPITNKAVKKKMEMYLVAALFPQFSNSSTEAYKCYFF